MYHDTSFMIYITKLYRVALALADGPVFFINSRETSSIICVHVTCKTNLLVFTAIINE